MGLILIMVVSFMNLFSISSADIWKKHINSNKADEILCNDDVLWVNSDGDSLVLWDLTSGEPMRYYDGHGLESSSINGMTFDSENNLIARIGYNIYYFEDGAFNFLTERYSYYEYFGYADGSIIMGARYDEGVFKFDREKWEELPGLSEYNVYSDFWSDPRGGFWFNTLIDEEMHLIYYNGEVKLSFIRNEVTNIDKPMLINQIYVDSKETVWACLRGGVAWFDGEGWMQYYWNEDMSNYVFNVVEDIDGNLWFSATLDGLFKFDGENLINIPEYDNVKVLWVENSPTGGVWVGTEDSLEFFDGTTRTPYIISNLLPISNNLEAITIAPDGDLWCGDYLGDLALLHRNEWKTFRGRKLIASEDITGWLCSMHYSLFSGLWVGFCANLYNYNQETWTSFKDILDPEIGTFCSDLLEGPDGEMWVSSNSVTRRGLAKWDGNSWEFHHPTMSIPQRNDVMAFDPEGNLLFTSGFDLYKWDGIEWKIIKDFNDEDVPIDNFGGLTITAMSDGTQWVGGGESILVFYEDKIVEWFTEENGFPCESPENPTSLGIQAIKQAPDGTVWILTTYGLIHYDGVQFKNHTNEDAGFRIGSTDLAIDSIGRIFIISNSGLTEFTPTSVTLKMNLFAPGLMYKAGDTFSLSLNVNNYGPDETGDLYFVMMTPDGRLYSGLDWTEGVRPAGKNITIPEGFAMPMIEALKVTLPADKPPIAMPGKYYFALSLADSGTTYFRAKAVTSIDVVK